MTLCRIFSRRVAVKLLTCTVDALSAIVVLLLDPDAVDVHCDLNGAETEGLLDACAVGVTDVEFLAEFVALFSLSLAASRCKTTRK